MPTSRTPPARWLPSFRPNIMWLPHLVSRLLAASLVLAISAPLPAGAIDKVKKAKPGKGKTPAAAESAVPSDGPPPEGSSPLAELKKSNAQLVKILSRRTADWSPEAEARRTEVKEIVSSFLDFEELSRRALIKHWDGLRPEQRSDFVATLRELAERSYIEQVHGNPKYDISFDKETRQDREALVTASLQVERRVKGVAKKATIALEYKLVWKGGRWVVYDVVTDEQSLLENYRAEFNKIIAKDSFDVLLSKLKKKLADRAPAKTGSSGGTAPAAQ